MNDAEEYVVLVDADDREIGVERKLETHVTGARHRAISVFLADRFGRALLQRRSLEKYHSPGLWANACCGHPRPGETAHAAATRRLREELGLETPLGPAGRLNYWAELPMQLVENEIVHLFVGTTDAAPRPDPSEVMDWRWFEQAELARMIADQGDQFAAWFRIYAARLPALALGGSV